MTNPKMMDQKKMMHLKLKGVEVLLPPTISQVMVIKTLSLVSRFESILTKKYYSCCRQRCQYTSNITHWINWPKSRWWSNSEQSTCTRASYPWWQEPNLRNQYLTLITDPDSVSWLCNTQLQQCNVIVWLNQEDIKSSGLTIKKSIWCVLC